MTEHKRFGGIPQNPVPSAMCASSWLTRLTTSLFLGFVMVLAGASGKVLRGM